MGQPQPIDSVARYGSHIAIASHIYFSADDSCAGREEVVCALGQQPPVGQQLAVECAHHHPSVTESHCPDDVVIVGKSVVDEVAVEEAVGSLVGGSPQAVPLVYKECFYHIEARGKLPPVAVVVEPDGVRVGNYELPLPVLTNTKAIVGSIEAVLAQAAEAVALYTVETVGSQGQQSVGCADEREHVGLGGQLLCHLPLLQPIDALRSGQI